MTGWKGAVSPLHTPVNQEEGIASIAMFSVGIITREIDLVI
jgi:hypothetical protein